MHRIKEIHPAIQSASYVPITQTQIAKQTQNIKVPKISFPKLNTPSQISKSRKTSFHFVCIRCVPVPHTMFTPPCLAKCKRTIGCPDDAHGKLSLFLHLCLALEFVCVCVCAFCGMILLCLVDE